MKKLIALLLCLTLSQVHAAKWLPLFAPTPSNLSLIFAPTQSYTLNSVTTSSLATYLSSSGSTFVRASEETCIDSSNNFTFATANNPCITNTGLGYYPAHTNGITNNTMVGGSAPSTLPNGWALVNLGTGLTASYTYTTVNGAAAINVTFAGTATGTSFPSIFLDAGNITGAAGTEITPQLYAALTAGSFSNISQAVFRIADGAGNQDISFLGATSTLNRFGNVLTLRTGTTSYFPSLAFTINAGTINVTFTIVLPDSGAATALTPPVRTSGSVASRSADAFTNQVPSPLSTLTATFIDNTTQNITGAGGSYLLSGNTENQIKSMVWGP